MSDVWIVDDDPFYQNYLAMYLNTTGYKTKCFSNGEECIAHLKEKPLAILLDHNLGTTLNGVDILRIIKEIDASIPVISISGTDRTEIVSESFRSGSEDFVLKDSASLIRLKIQLERLTSLSIDQNQVKRRNKKIYIASILLVTIVIVVLIVLTFR